MNCGYSLVELGHVDLDVAEVGPLRRVLGPAAVHQDGQLLRVALGVGRGPKVRLLTVPHLLHDLWGGGGHTQTHTDTHRHTHTDTHTHTQTHTDRHTVSVLILKEQFNIFFLAESWI